MIKTRFRTIFRTVSEGDDMGAIVCWRNRPTEFEERTTPATRWGTYDVEVWAKREYTIYLDLWLALVMIRWHSKKLKPLNNGKTRVA